MQKTENATTLGRQLPSKKAKTSIPYQFGIVIDPGQVVCVLMRWTDFLGEAIAKTLL